ncbi:hypothetical protein BS47DRAFT_1362575 [Hydnum rufescens UP504]|uniref:Uncharacterized protein n=1 Tax=Hydnum rufescens UP504 TaxID=1448309 RepID=A0A9P6DTH3_9AGAM|nr:hypothetical protein BS47DRAFT_1362575 [Hydnum rufescens UP504]
MSPIPYTLPSESPSACQGPRCNRGDDRRVGYYVGLIDSTFFLTECLCVLQWGDYRMTAGLTLSLTCIGLSRTFGALILSRSLTGLTDGNIVVIRSAIGELADSTNIASDRWLSLEPEQAISKDIWRFSVLAYIPLPSSLSGSSIVPTLGAHTFDLVFSRDCAPPVALGGMEQGRGIQNEPESTALLPNATPAHRSASVRSILTKRVIIAAANYCLLALASISYSVLQPLFLSTPIQHGGLGLDPARIGYILAVQGVVGAFWVLMFSARLQQIFGVKTVFSMTMAVFMVLFSAFPMMNAFARVEDRIGWQVWFIWLPNLFSMDW